jgi:hypothetical protein
MPPAKALRRRIASILAAVVLFAQLATAAYACPTPAASAPMRTPGMAGMPCEQMMAGQAALDAEQPALCFQHCQADTGQPPFDLAQAGAAFTPALVLLFALAPASRAAHDAPVWSAQRSIRERAPPAPHSLLHCCYRI